MAQAQQPPPVSGGQTQPASQQPAPGAPPQAHGGPLYDPLLQDADEENVPTDLFSRISFEYDHLMYCSGADGERLRIEGEQTFGENRLGIGYEIPFYFNIHGGPEPDNGAGLGD